jgi:hypothetical protein
VAVSGYAADMDDRARTAYRAIATLFLVLGGGVIVVGLLEDLLGFTFFRGDPSWVGLFIGAIGGLLYWTARDRDAG